LPVSALLRFTPTPANFKNISFVCLSAISCPFFIIRRCVPELVPYALPKSLLVQGTFSAYMFNLHSAGGALGKDGLRGCIIERHL